MNLMACVVNVLLSSAASVTITIDTEHHDIHEILLNLVLSINQSTIDTETIIRTEHLGWPRFLVGSVLLIILVFCVVLFFCVLFVFVCVLCAQCCQYHLTVHCCLPLRFSLTFIFVLGYPHKILCTRKSPMNSCNNVLSGPIAVLFCNKIILN